MRIPLWFSFAVTLFTTGIVSIVAPFTPTIYHTRPKDMPWPPMTEIFFHYGGGAILLALPFLWFAIKFSRRTVQIESAIAYISIALSTCIFVIILAAFCMLLPVVNTYYWD